MTETEMRSGRMNVLGPLLIWVAIGWGVGVWQGWWLLGPKSVVIAVLIALGFVSGARVRGTRSPPAPETVRAEIERLHLKGQGRQLRHLVYQVAADWPNQRGDDAPWAGVKFLIDSLGLILRVGVSATLDEENRTPALMQAYAKNHYENQVGMTVIRNEITSLAGHWCVVTDAVHPRSGQVRRYSFTFHLSEYVVQFTFATQAHFSVCEPFMDAVVSLCSLKVPRLVDRSVLGGRITIGIPGDWTQTIDEERLTVWRALPGPLDVRLNLLDESGQVEIDEAVFERVPGYERPPGCLFRKIRMDENGVSGLRIMWSSPAFRNYVELVMDAVRLPNGLTVVLATKNQGNGEETFQGFNVDTLRLELLASLRPGDTPVL